MKKVSIKSILNKIFFNEVDTALLKLKQYGFDIILEQKINLIYKRFQSKNISDIDIIASSFLQTVNTKLKEITSKEDELFVKYLLTDIGNHLIQNFKNVKTVTYRDLDKLNNTFKSICEIEGYDYKDLENRIGLKNKIDLLKVNQDGVLDTKPVYYDWLKSNSSLDFLIDDLKSEKMIKVKNEFNSLFTQNPLKTKINAEFKEFIFILFDTLYEKKIIQPRVKKGHFLPLIQNAVDFDGNILYLKKANSYKFTIKKNKEKSNKLKRKSLKWIEKIN